MHACSNDFIRITSKCNTLLPMYLQNWLFLMLGISPDSCIIPNSSTGCNITVSDRASSFSLRNFIVVLIFPLFTRLLFNFCNNRLVKYSSHPFKGSFCTGVDLFGCNLSFTISRLDFFLLFLIKAFRMLFPFNISVSFLLIFLHFFKPLVLRPSNQDSFHFDLPILVFRFYLQYG